MNTVHRLKVALGVTLATFAAVAMAATFTTFTPATGILKGSATSPVTTAATSSDVRGLWSGTCNSTTFLRGDGSCVTPSGTVSSVGLTMPSGFSVAGSPVTSSGTLAVTTTLNGPLRGNGSAFITGNTSLTTEVSGTLPVGNGGTGATTLTGPLKGNGTSAFTAATSSDIIGLWTGTCNSTTFLRADGSCQSPGGGGTVTSVGMTVPAFLSVSGSPVTGSGTLAVSLSGTALPVANGGTGTTTSTGSGSVVLSTSPALTTPTVGGQQVCVANGTNCQTFAIDVNPSSSPFIVACIRCGASPSISRSGAGQFTITHNVGNSNYKCTAASRNTGGTNFLASFQGLNANDLFLYTYNAAGALTDATTQAVMIVCTF